MSAKSAKPEKTDRNQEILDSVREGYSRIAGSEGSCCGCGCGGGAPQDLTRSLGYSGAALSALPEGTDMGLSCGNPLAIAELSPGDILLDLGSGGGLDVFIAGPLVGEKGRAIGIDMTPEMIGKARRGAVGYRERTGLDNIEFRLGEIEHLPVADAAVDVVVSNCVLNLSPRKDQVWREIFRVLRPGGRVAVSDLALLKPLPAAVAADVEALIGCVAGAVPVADTEQMALAAGLVDLVLIPKSGYIESMTEWRDPLYDRIVAALPPGDTPADYITSLEVRARKP